MNLLEIGQIKRMREELEAEEIDTEDISLIQEAFDELVASGHPLRDLPENAMAADMLDEIESALPELAWIMYDYVAEHFGDNEADDPCYYITPFAFHIEAKLKEAQNANSKSV